MTGAAELDRTSERVPAVQVDARDPGCADGPDHDRFGRVVAEGECLSPVVALGDGRIEPERVLREISAVAGAGGDRQAGMGGRVEERGRDGADPAGQRAVGVDVVTDDDRAGSVAGPSRHLADRGPEVEGRAGLDDEPVKAAERDDDVRPLAVGRPDDVGDRPAAQQDEVRLERHGGPRAGGGRRARRRPAHRHWREPAVGGRRDGRRRHGRRRCDGGASRRGNGRGDPNRRGRWNVLGGPGHGDLDGRGRKDHDGKGARIAFVRCREHLWSSAFRAVGMISTPPLHPGSTPKAAGRCARRAWSSVMTLASTRLWLVEDRRRDTDAARVPDVFASDDEDPAVVQERRGVAATARTHRADRAVLARPPGRTSPSRTGLATSVRRSSKPPAMRTRPSGSRVAVCC